MTPAEAVHEISEAFDKAKAKISQYPGAVSFHFNDKGLGLSIDLAQIELLLAKEDQSPSQR